MPLAATAAQRQHCRLGCICCGAVADPFLWQHYDGLYMFYETKSTAKRRGEIGVARSTDGGVSFTHLGVVLSERWHMSYPFVFGYKGQVCWQGQMDCARPPSSICKVLLSAVFVPSPRWVCA
jgi:hypothetical protein